MDSPLPIVLATMLHAIVPFFNTTQISSLSHKYKQKKGEAALEYAQSHLNTYMLFVFPMAEQKDDQKIQDILKDFGKIIHSKKLFLSENAAINFFRLIYKGHGKHKGEWLGTQENNFAGARRAVKERFSRIDVPLRVYLFECNNLLTLQQCKFKLRKFFRLGRETVHANDTYEETIKIAQVLFKNNAENVLVLWQP